MSVSVEIYRPPLWAQTGEFDAADDRQVITAMLWPGVIEAAHLKVQPHSPSPNLTVDVAPGLVVVAGTDQPDQGTFVCPLSQTVNVPLVHGPAPPNTRSDLIIARVYEPGDQDAYWRVEPVMGTANPDGRWQFPPTPASSIGLAVVDVGDQFTTQITPERITDLRHLSRPVPQGSTFAQQAQLGPNAVFVSQEVRWGAVSQRIPGGAPGEPPGPPLDVEVRVEGVMRTETGAAAIGSIAINLSVGSDLDGWTHRLPPVSVYSARTQEEASFSRTLLVRAAPRFGDRVLAEAAIAEVPLNGAGARFHDGLLTVRATPAGAAL